MRLAHEQVYNFGFGDLPDAAGSVARTQELSEAFNNGILLIHLLQERK